MRLIFIAFCFFPGMVSAETGCLLAFNEFLFNFEADRGFQQSNIVYPLKHSYIDLEAEPDPKIVENLLSQSDVAARDKPIYPSSAIQRAVPYIKEIKNISPTRSVVNFHKPDSGYVLIYYFEKMNECWMLVEFEDPTRFTPLNPVAELQEEGTDVTSMVVDAPLGEE